MDTEDFDLQEGTGSVGEETFFGEADPIVLEEGEEGAEKPEDSKPGEEPDDAGQEADTKEGEEETEETEAEEETEDEESEETESGSEKSTETPTPDPELEVLRQRKEAWGAAWDVEDEARQIAVALLDGDHVALAKAMLALSPVTTRQYLAEYMSTEAIKFIAAKHKITPELAADRLSAKLAVDLPEDVDTLLGAIPEEQAKKIRAVYEDAKAAKEASTDTAKQLEEARGKLERLETEKVEAEFQSNFTGDAFAQILEKVGPGQDQKVYESVYLEAYTRAMQSKDFKAAVDKYEAAHAKQEPEKRLKSLWAGIQTEFGKGVDEALATRVLPEAKASEPKTPGEVLKAKTTTPTTQKPGAKAGVGTEKPSAKGKPIDPLKEDFDSAFWLEDKWGPEHDKRFAAYEQAVAKRQAKRA